MMFIQHSKCHLEKYIWKKDSFHITWERLLGKMVNLYIEAGKGNLHVAHQQHMALCMSLESTEGFLLHTMALHEQ